MFIIVRKIFKNIIDNEERLSKLNMGSIGRQASH